MIEKLKETFSHAFIFGLGGVLTKLIGFILIPLYTREISVAEYGILGLLEFFGQLLIILFSFGQIPALFRWFNLLESEKEKNKIFFTVIISLSGIFFLASTFGILFKNSISQFITGEKTNSYLIAYIFISYSTDALKNILLTIYRINKKPLRYIIILSLSLIINLLLNIYFVAFRKLSIEGVLIGNTISSILTLIALIFDNFKNLSPQLELREFYKMLRFGFPMVLSGFSGVLLMMSDRYLLRTYATLDDVGIYTLGYKIAGIINLVLIQSFSLAWPAVAWDAFKKPNVQRFISKVLTYFVFITLWIILAFSIFSKEIIHVLIKNNLYWESIKIVPIIALSYSFYGMYYLTGIVFHFKNKTKYLPIILGFCAGFNIILNIILIPRFTIYGAAYSTLASYIIMFLLTYYLGQKTMPIPYESRKLWLIFICIGILFYLISIIPSTNLILRIGIKCIIILLFPLILYIFNFYERIELQRIREIVNKYFFRKKSDFLKKTNG